ncbi:hypothetical protein KA005_45820 [bacterium]|nr:hypothetical protein [bacterium]
MKLLDVTVRPRQLPLTGDRNNWEFYLLHQGFNELPSIKQYGVIQGAYSTGEVQVYWPHVNRSSFVFLDEICFAGEED